jgi:hypothetical protein
MPPQGTTQPREQSNQGKPGPGANASARSTGEGAAGQTSNGSTGRTESTGPRPSREEVDRLMADMSREEEERPASNRPAQNLRGEDRTTTRTVRPTRTGQDGEGSTGVGKLR